MKKAIIHYQLLILILALSCKKYEITEKDMELIPYSQNEILVFESGKQELDTIFISGFKNYLADSDPLAILPNKIEFYSVEYEFKDSNYDRYLPGELIKIQGSKHHEIFIWLNINIGTISGNCSLSKKEIIESSSIKWTFQNKSIEDVKVLESDIYTGNYPEKIFWSISQGLMGIESDKGFWKLKNKYVP